MFAPLFRNKHSPRTAHHPGQVSKPSTASTASTACVPSGLAGEPGFFHAPSSLEVGGGMLVSFPAPSRAEKQKNKPWFNKNRKGETESLSQDAWSVIQKSSMGSDILRVGLVFFCVDFCFVLVWGFVWGFFCFGGFFGVFLRIRGSGQYFGSCWSLECL